MWGFFSGVLSGMWFGYGFLSVAWRCGFGGVGFGGVWVLEECRVTYATETRGTAFSDN